MTGFEVREENNPLHAIETARKFKPDVVFLDILMPELDGGTLAAQFKDDRALGKTPIVFFDSDPREGARPIYGATGNYYEFLTKPASRQQLVDCIQRCFNAVSLLAYLPRYRSEYSDPNTPTTYRGNRQHTRR